MANVIKLRKGLDINLTGKASKDVTLQVAQAGEYALVPAAFVGVTPKVVTQVKFACRTVARQYNLSHFLAIYY